MKQSGIHQASVSNCPVCAHAGAHEFTGRDLMFDGDRTFDYHCCSHCGLIYQHPIPSNEEISQFYPDSYSIYKQPGKTDYSRRMLLTLKNTMGYRDLKIPDKRHFFSGFRKAKPVHNIIPFVPGGVVLDIGCGNGEQLLRLRSIGWRCQGVEFNEKAVAICRQHDLDVYHGDLKSAAFPSESFDFVTANHLIEHVPDPHGLMSEIARVTKPGGAVLIRTPNSQSIGRSWFGRDWFANEVPRHLMLYSSRNLQLLADRYGLQLEKIATPVKPKLLLRSLDYRLGNTGKPMEKRMLMKWLSIFYIPIASLNGRGDELFALFKKR